MTRNSSAKRSARIRSQLGQILLARGPARLDAVGGVLSDSLAALETRIAGSAWVTSLTGARLAAQKNAGRVREVLDRDRALVAAFAPAREQDVKVPPSVPAPPATAPDPRQAALRHEPIRTRTMAQLLAAQGHRDRALAIYDALLLAAADSDPELRAEAERLRSQLTAAQCAPPGE